MNKYMTKLFLAFLLYVPVISCTHHTTLNNAVPDEYAASRITTTPAPEWAEMLRHTDGWLGADGIYSVSMNGVEKPGMLNANSQTMFWFSDCIIGHIDAKADTMKEGWGMLNNSVAYMDGATPDPDKIHFYYRNDAKGNPLSMFEPATPNLPPDSYYWLGDGFFNHAKDSTIYIFAYLIHNIPGSIFPFEDIGVSLIAIPKGSKPPFTNQRQMTTPLFLKDTQGKGKTVFGICVMPNTIGSGAPKPDGYVYVYGIRGINKELLVARVKDTEFEDFSKWRYWDGMDWNTDINKSAAVLDNISNEMSVSYMADGRVIAAFQMRNDATAVAISAGQTPRGPFQPAKKVWQTPEAFDDLDFYTYNAKAHPHLSKPGELLISYNVNSFDFLDDIVKHPYHLRPRFVRVRY